MPTTWKARPTTYRGIRMRSRLEAKVAQWLDESEATWEYEPRAYADEHGQYLPDFEVRLPGDDAWSHVFIEAKPTLEQALKALERVQIIWSSLPRVALMVWSDDCGIFLAFGSRDRKWTFRPTDAA